VNIFDQGNGEALIVIPGLHGRWEWATPTLHALARRCRTLSYTLAHATAFDQLVAQLDAVLDERGIQSAAICGVSFGGLVAVRYAALRPERTKKLVIVSSPSPSWHPNERQARYLSRPWLSTPAFLATTPLRMWPEIRSAFDSSVAALKFVTVHSVRVAAAPIVPAAMATRLELIDGHDFCADCARVTAPTLVVTGEDRLDSVVPPQSTREYASLISGARHETLDRTGHLGLITRPDSFAAVVGSFVDANHS
jgi:3-oxoadipate enol-lactonase